MAIHVALKHRTEYHFDRLVEIFPHIVRLRPAPHCRTSILSYSLKVTPDENFINWQQDPFANYLARFVFPKKAKSLIIDVELVAEMTVINPFDFFLEESAQKFPFQYQKELAKDLAPYLEIKEQGSKLKTWLQPWQKQLTKEKQATVDFLVAVNAQLQSDIGYVVRMEPGVQACEETLTLAKGSCRDSAWLLVQILRHLGLAARFVSGYLVQLTADMKSLDGPSGPEKDFTDLHAWTEVFIPGAGWVGLDPTSGLFAAEGHIPLACTPDPSTAAAIDGSTAKCEVEFRYSNTVTRIYEDPRVTKPYSEEQWRDVMQLGHYVDAQLNYHNVRLTMGGEPTFVSIDDMEGAEWNNAALGTKKLELAKNLLQKIKKRYGEQGFTHFGQGKWYPGEPLPRWVLSLFWRTDGHPLWRDPQYLVTEKSEQGKTNCTVEHAQKFIQLLTNRLGLTGETVIAGYEDNAYYLMREAHLPENLSPEDNRLADPLERKRLAKVFERGLDTEVGFALPISRENKEAREQKQGKSQWCSSRWSFRREHMFLLPGDSPMGLRLPLDSLPWVELKKRKHTPERDPFAKREPLMVLPPLHYRDSQSASAQLSVRQQSLSDNRVSESGAESMEEVSVIHTALCVEARDGYLHIFMPPLPYLEDYVELLAQIENCCAALKQPVVIEGYEPPRDARLKKLQITPDPGVIEVNIHPAHSWDELLDIIEKLYEDARQSRLGTEKFMLDGRHTGTGGGNHVTVGAAQAQDSPFLRRPDLLRSMITYWQNHPCLSYLFSGLFIGPTSQAPRVDEARNDHLHELEIAFAQLSTLVKPGEEAPQPWLVDRILRNFLVDLTGNTHRSEFCIDKLYSPDSATGRLGLVEFRNFEMPPHARMSVVQMLLLRSLIAWFWQQPYQQKLIRWGMQLHDQFMLPHFVWEDLRQVIVDLNYAGFAMDLNWFKPFQEFRFPHYGMFRVQGMQLDLHSAIEPWHVLGEESTGQGTARYVDSSVERLQITTRGLNEGRYIVTCNGKHIPLHATETNGQLVAGIRFKAWSPWSALHPTIPVQAPLVFDIVDCLNERSIGGCTYHVAHPGGRNYDTFPVNANEAEARRIARFWPHGHTQGKMKIDVKAPHPEHPYTLDLRL